MNFLNGVIAIDLLCRLRLLNMQGRSEPVKLPAPLTEAHWSRPVQYLLSLADKVWQSAFLNKLYDFQIVMYDFHKHDDSASEREENKRKSQEF